MPVKPYGFYGLDPTLLEITGERERHENEQRDHADADVEAVKSSQREKRGCEQIGIDHDAFMENAQIFPTLANNENGSEQDCKRQQPAKRGMFFGLQFFPREPDREAAREQAQRENSGSLRIQHAGRRRPVHDVAVVIEISQNEHEKENTFGDQKADDAHPVFFQNKSVPRGDAADDWIRIFRVRQIPQGPAAADRRHAIKIMRGRRRGRGPFQRPGVPWIIARRFAVAQTHDDIPQ